jgi:hypothetical protein
MLIACKLIVWEFGNVIWTCHLDDSWKEFLQRKGIRVEVKQEIAWHCRRMEMEITSLD